MKKSNRERKLLSKRSKWKKHGFGKWLPIVRGRKGNIFISILLKGNK